MPRGAKKSHHHGFLHGDGINFGFTGSSASQVQQSGNALLALRNLNGHGNGDGRADHGAVAHATGNDLELKDCIFPYVFTIGLDCIPYNPMDFCILSKTDGEIHFCSLKNP